MAVILWRPILDLAARSPVGKQRVAAVLVPPMLDFVTHSPSKQTRKATYKSLRTATDF